MDLVEIDTRDEESETQQNTLKKPVCRNILPTHHELTHEPNSCRHRRK
jgi:hypothetical protein